MDQTPQDMKRVKESLLAERDHLTSTYRPEGDLPFPRFVCERLLKIWRQVADIDRCLLAEGITDIGVKGFRSRLMVRGPV